MPPLDPPPKTPLEAALLAACRLRVPRQPYGTQVLEDVVAIPRPDGCLDVTFRLRNDPDAFSQYDGSVTWQGEALVRPSPARDALPQLLGGSLRYLTSGEAALAVSERLLPLHAPTCDP